MNHFARLAVPSLLAVTGSIHAQGGGDCLDQSYLPSPQTNGLEITANQPVTQTFTVGRDGFLTRIELAQLNHHRQTPTQPLQVDVVLTDAAGVPTTNALASVTLPPASVPSSRGGSVQIDLTSFNVFALRGQRLGIALSSNAMPGGNTYAWWGEAPGGGYPDGEVFIRGTTQLSVWDLSFQTWTTAPASSRNYGSGHAGTNGIPSLTLSTNPVLGASTTLTIGNSLGAATMAGVVAGAQAISQPTPFGGTLLVQPTVSATVPVPVSNGVVPVSIPNDPLLCGVSVFFQAIVIDGGASNGLAFTPGLEAVIGV